MTGILPPLPTPFRPDGALDLDALAGLIGGLEPHVDGFLVLGSNGEAVHLDDDERREVVRAARAAAGDDTPLLVGTGAAATRTAERYAREAAEDGADAVLVLPPSYFRGLMTEAALEAHFRRVADASPVPVWLYDMPAATGLPLAPALVGRLARHPNIRGLKDSSGNVGALAEVLRIAPSGFTVMTGNAPTLLPALALGAHGGILAVANVAAPGFRRIYERARAGDLAEARALQLELLPLARAVTTQYGVPGLKAAMTLLGLPAGEPRAPLLPATDAAKEEIRGLLERMPGLWERARAAG